MARRGKAVRGGGEKITATTESEPMNILTPLQVAVLRHLFRMGAIASEKGASVGDLAETLWSFGGADAKSQMEETLGNLKAQGLVEQNGVVRLTDAGVKFVARLERDRGRALERSFAETSARLATF